MTRRERSQGVKTLNVLWRESQGAWSTCPGSDRKQRRFYRVKHVLSEFVENKDLGLTLELLLGAVIHTEQQAAPLSSPRPAGVKHSGHRRFMTDGIVSITSREQHGGLCAIIRTAPAPFDV